MCDAECNDAEERDELEAAAIDRRAAAAELAALEECFSEDQDDEAVRRDLHLARVRSGWREFVIDTESGADPRSVIPWAAIREVTWTEKWTGHGAPSPVWLRSEAQVKDRGLVRKVWSHRLCDDNEWRRDVTEELDVVAVEDLDHFCSIAERMKDVVLYKEPHASGLQRVTVYDGTT